MTRIDNKLQDFLENIKSYTLVDIYVDKLYEGNHKHDSQFENGTVSFSFMDEFENINTIDFRLTENTITETLIVKFNYHVSRKMKYEFSLIDRLIRYDFDTKSLYIFICTEILDDEGMREILLNFI